jgi:hypothetical protein
MPTETSLVPVAQSNAEVLFDEKFSQAELEVLRGLLDPTGRVDLVIPKDMNPQDLWVSFEVCCKAISRIKRASSAVKPLIGRMLVVLQDYPEVITAHGYANYEDFMVRGMDELFGISRAEAYACRQMAEHLPSLTVEDFREIGVAKLYLVAQATDEKQKDCAEFLEFARNHTVSELKQKVATKKHLAKGELDAALIMIPANRDIEKAWKSFWTDKRIQAFCETENPGRIFACMIAECANSWQSQGEFLLNGGR